MKYNRKIITEKQHLAKKYVYRSYKLN